MVKKFLKNHPIHKKIVIYLDFIYLLSPLNYFTIWSMLCVGMYLGMFSLNKSPQFIIDIHCKVLFLFLGITSLMSSSFINAQFFKLENSKIVKSIKGKYTEKFIIKFNKCLNIFGLVLLFFSFWINFILGILLFFINKYSFKDNLLSKSIYQLLIAFIISINGFIYVLKDYQLILYIPSYIKFIFPYILLYVAVGIIFYVKDIDFKYKYLNFLCLSSFLLILLGVILSLQFYDPLASISLVVSSPFFLYAFIRGLDKDYQRVLSYPLGILNFFCMTIFPYLFIASIMVFYLTKYYNWHRLDVHHPTFLVEND